ncbi:MAG: DUF3368 domain-containing protein [Chloroflexi bacterium]|nr:DUF3368 domain-containing protein [Chloroflexota bacterium]
MPDRVLCCDTSILLYLGRIGQLSLLPSLFDAVTVPGQVVLELDMGRLMQASIVDPRQFDWISLVNVPVDDIASLPPNRLGAGERSVIAYAWQRDGCVVGLDDRLARLLAEQPGLEVIGLVGLLFRSQKAGLISLIKPKLDQLLAAGFRLNDDVYREALALAGETQ